MFFPQFPSLQYLPLENIIQGALIRDGGVFKIQYERGGLDDAKFPSCVYM